MIQSNTIQVRDLIVEHRTLSGPLRALDCAELVVPGGTSIAIVGPSGSGKSTLLSMLAGLAMPTRGAVSIGATALTALSEPHRIAYRKRAIGVVYQADNLLPFLTASENVRLQLALCGDTEHAATRTAGLLNQLGLGDLEERLPDQLSGGQRQRVAIARAIVHRPSVVLADEPTGALDDENAAITIALLVDATRQLGSTLVVVTHDPSVAGRMERLVTLRDGLLVDDRGVSHAD